MLKINQRRAHMNPLRARGSASAMEVVDCNKADMRNQYGVFEKYSSMPQGFRPPTVWLLAPSDGSISSFDEAIGGAELSIVLVDAQERSISVEGGAITSAVVIGIGERSATVEGGATCAVTMDAVALLSGNTESGATLSATLSATIPFFVSAQAGSTATLSPTKVVFIAGASLDDGAISVDTISSGVWSHPKGKQVSNNSAIIPALL